LGANLTELLRDQREMAALILGLGVEAAIRQHGRETYPNECCGALIGDGADVQYAVGLPNTTEEGPRRRFLVRPVDYRRAEEEARQRGGALLGFYHSHPDAPARPSQYDLDHAWPTFWYIILAVERGEPAAMTVWQLNDDRSRFEERRLEVPGLKLKAES
jgi:proteasome lid subunit RPN8/RPN11